jgi:hypothetical protein
MINPFVADGYSMAALTAAIDRAPFTPSRIAEMALFSNEGVNQTVVMIEERDGALVLIPNTRRGAPAANIPGMSRKLRHLACTHLPVEDAITADDLLGMREFGSEEARETLNGKVNEKLGRMKQALAATLEYMRLTAIKGILCDGAGTTVYNLFTEFGIPAPAAVDFLLGTTTTDIRGMCMDVITAVSTGLNGLPMNHVHAFCGNTFYKRLVGHTDVKTQLQWLDPQRNTTDPRMRGFVYGDIVWEPYRGSANGVPFIGTNECRFFPVGSPGVFRTFYAPSTWLESLGQQGQPLYAKQVANEDNSGIKLLGQSNPLPICTHPGTLVQGTSSN